MNKQLFFYRLVLFVLTSVLLVTISYFFFDKTVAEFAYYHQTRKFYFIDWFTYIAPILEYFAFVFIVYYLWCKITTRILTKHHYFTFVVATTTIITIEFKNTLKFIFGRYWPNTWIDNNLSWLQNHAYGFHFFHNGDAYGSFPSGHAATVFTVVTLLWLNYPRFRFLYALLGIMMLLAQLTLYYHFLSDLLAGACLGIFAAILAQRAFITTD